MDQLILDRPPTILEPLRLDAPPGMTLAEIVALTEIPAILHDRVLLLLNGRVVRDWAHVYTREGDTLTIGVVPAGGGGGGGKRIFAAVATLAIAVAAPFAASALLGAGFVGGAAAVAAGVSPLAHAGLTLGLTLVGSLAVAALVPPPSLGTTPGAASSVARSGEESPTYSFGGQANRARVFSTVKRVYGRYRVYADLAAVPLIDNIGRTSTIAGLYYFSAGDCELEDIRFGDQSIDTYEPQIRVLQDSRGTNLKYVHRAVGYDEFAYALADTQWLQLQTKLDTVKAIVDLTFPRGLVRMNRAERLTATVPIEARWRLKGSGDPWEYLTASKVSGAPDSDSGGVAYTPEYDFDGSGIGANDTTAWVVQTKNEKDGSKTRILIYRNGQKIYQTKDYEPGQEAARTTIRTGGVTYAAGQYTGDTSQSTDEKSETYAELLVGRAITGNAVRISESTREPFTVGARFNFPDPGIYEIEVRRTVAPTPSDAIADDITVTLLRSFAAGPVLNLSHRATMLELEVVASDQLRGSIPPVNALVASRLRRFNSSGFTGAVRESSNPAEIAVDLLTGGPRGDQTRFPLAASQIEFADFKRLRDICADVRTQVVNGVAWTGPRFEWNGVIETDRPLGEVVNDVLSIARAQLRFTASGKIGCLIDEEQTVPRALITPANSWGFSGSRPFPQRPHALRINFTDEDRDYAPASLNVYGTGHSEKTATIFEDIDAWGVTNYAEAWRFGRFMLAQAIMRSETFTVSQDAEHLAVQRGELVEVQHDVPLQGGMSARVTEVAGDAITIDRPYDGAPNGYVARSDAGAVTSGAVVAATGPDTFVAAAGHAIAPGDLITLGSAGTVTEPYLVKSIEPGEDFSARLQLVRYDPAVYADEAGALPPWDPGFGESLVSGASIAVDPLTATQEWEYTPRHPAKDVALAWRIVGQNPSVYRTAIIELRRGTNDWRQVGSVVGGVTRFTHRIGWEDRALWPELVTYRVRPFTALGHEGGAAEVQIRLTDYDMRPEPPRKAFLDVRDEEVTISWDFSTSPDVANYLIRYSPETTGVTWHGAIPLAAVSWDQDQATFKARTGSYLLRAVNYSGQASDIVYLRTTIEELPNINVIEVIDESDPATPGGMWPGVIYRFSKGAPGITVTATPVLHLDGVTFTQVFLAPISYDVALLGGGSVNIAHLMTWGGTWLVSDQDWRPDTSQDRAVYTVAEVVDLGGIYEAVLQAKHEAFAVIEHDLPRVLSAPSLPDGLHLLDDDDPIPWDCWAEYRSAAAANPINAWPAISSVGALASAGAQYGPWRRFNATQATARWFEFRLVAESEQDGVRIVVTGGRIEIDMEDRVQRVENVAVQAGGTVVPFDPAFAAKPVVAVTIEGATTAVRYEALSVDRNGVELALYDAGGTSVAGQVDVAALGYGKERGAPI